MGRSKGRVWQQQELNFVLWHHTDHSENPIEIQFSQYLITIRVRGSLFSESLCCLEKCGRPEELR